MTFYPFNSDSYNFWTWPLCFLHIVAAETRGFSRDSRVQYSENKRYENEVFQARLYPVIRRQPKHRQYVTFFCRNLNGLPTALPDVLYIYKFGSAWGGGEPNTRYQVSYKYEGKQSLFNEMKGEGNVIPVLF
jgi:hypothetical protein